MTEFKKGELTQMAKASGKNVKLNALTVGFWFRRRK